jgi:hypothetical protein
LLKTKPKTEKTKMTTEKIKKILNSSNTIYLSVDSSDNIIEIIPYTMNATIKSSSEKGLELLNIKMFNDESCEWESFLDDEVFNLVKNLIKIK